MSSSDTVDFSEPRTICVYSASGKYSRDYVVKVNVHKQDGGGTIWNTTGVSQEFAARTAIRGFEMGDNL